MKQRPPTQWRRSSHSNGMGGECVEVSQVATMVFIRDSKISEGPQISLNAYTWACFVRALCLDSAVGGRSG